MCRLRYGRVTIIAIRIFENPNVTSFDAPPVCMVDGPTPHLRRVQLRAIVGQSKSGRSRFYRGFDLGSRSFSGATDRGFVAVLFL